MQSLKLSPSIAIELLILWFVLWFVAKTWAFPSFSDVGDIAFGLTTLYITLLASGTIFYIGLRLLLALQHKSLLTHIITATLIGFLLFLSLFLLFISRESAVPNSIIIALTFLPVTPLVLLGLRYLFLKVIAKKSSA